MRLIFFTFIFIVSLSSVAQEKSFTKIAESKGKLNNDNLTDKIIVLQDTINEKGLYVFQVYFGRKNGNYELFQSSKKAIPPYTEGANDLISFSEISIKNGILIIEFEFLRGHSSYKYRFQNDKFELIGVTAVRADSRGFYFNSDFNLSTGVRIVEEGRVDSDSITVKKEEKHIIKPLPHLDSFTPFESELY